MTVFCIILLILFALHWATADHRGHRWVYRTPYTRTCQSCGRQEDHHCNSWSWEARGFRAHGWWEEMRPGSGNKCKAVAEKSGAAE
ncbi:MULTISPECIES: hypothetical protein [unclassified Pseudomonas]|uniref:hypothetical protein n=1 Tax=unclassified Pseudomonas TaxID=196821 RepID=UPI00244A02D5|nr:MULTISPECIES: hypothetical protein [unclassified Pseudomonas]MDH0894239.1 hypothetical protein [Pseudomonas sp. GD03875]MDH1063466.1 hypothetical protein [Pseudomonas sp. GD03985]